MSLQKEHTQTDLHLEHDLKNMRTRIEQYKQLALTADMVVISLVCSDSRVVLPPELVNIKMENGSISKTLFMGVPTIGGGYPSQSRLRGVIRILEEWGVDKKKLRILATQHGSTKEIKNALKKNEADGEHKVTCGLRQFFEKYQVELADIRGRLIPWARRLKQERNDKKVAPDRLALEEIEQLYPELMAQVNELHQKSGMPRRLILRAAYRNSSFDIEQNELLVAEKVGEYLQHDEYQDIYPTCLVAAAMFDHQQKNIQLLHKHAGLGTKDKVIELGLPAREDSIQSPQFVIISFGAEAICLHNSTLFPDMVAHRADNAFRACASIPSVPTVMCAFSEAFYAVIHKVHPHDKNFADLERIVIVCDNDEYLRVVQEAIQGQEFQTEFKEIFAHLNQEISVVNLHLDQENAQVEHHEVELG